MIKTIITAIFITLPFANLANAEIFTTNAAKLAATNSSDNIHLAYLQCYALQDKQVCLIKLAAEYIDKKYQQDEEYKTAFQYEAEKLGFLAFLRKQNLPCKSISKGPKFIDQEKAYQVICDCNHHYLMRFDYAKKEWKLI